MSGDFATLARPGDPRIAALRTRLDSFYATTKDYTDFKAPTTKHSFWLPMLESIRRVVEARGTCRVLEFGAGMTTFMSWLREHGGEDLASRVTFHAQDVTPQNVEHLRTQASEVFIGPLHAVRGPYDVIFSTFVFEHVTDPKETLAHLFAMLEAGGSLLIACPRYDLPGYVPPSARHLGRIAGLALSARLWLSRIATRLDGKPRFYVHTDPAVFHGPWFVDADAVHWVSMADMRAALPAGYRMERVDHGLRGFKARVNFALILLFVRITRA